MRHGEGTFSFSKGKKYKGSFLQNKIMGKGTMSTSDGKTFTGNWIDGLMEGKGFFKI